MSKVGVSLKIDVTKIEKGRLFQGQKGTYLDATVFVDLDELDQYGNSGMVTQDVTKDEKSNGIKGAILGNCKVFWKGDGSGNSQAIQAGQKVAQQKQQQQQTQPAQNQGFDNDFSDDVPF